MALRNEIESKLHLDSVIFVQFPVISRITSFIGRSEQPQSKMLVLYEFSSFSFPLKSEF